MTNITSFSIIAITVFLVFLFFNFIFKKSSVEFKTFMTFITGVVVGLIFVNLNIEVLSTDLVYFSVSLFIVYLFFLAQKRKRIEKPQEVKKIEKITKKLYKNKSEVYEVIEESSNLEDYFYLKVEYEKGNVKNEKFQSKYKSFYNMYVFGFTEEFFNKYFDFLDQGETDLKKILTELSQIRNKNGKKSVQLAFASKLGHTIDSEMPLYNSTVSDLFKLSIPKGGVAKKINSSLEIYEKLKVIHGSLAARDKIQKMAIEFREKNNLKKGILSDSKLIDLFLRASKEV